MMLPLSFAARAQEQTDDTGDFPQALSTPFPCDGMPSWTLPLLHKATAPDPNLNLSHESLQFPASVTLNLDNIGAHTWELLP
jgi:hypothetical protein